MNVDAKTLALVATGGALGAVARYLAGTWLPRATFPTATLAVNVLGTFLLALFLFHSVATGSNGIPLRAFVAIGLLGAFTTMSAFGVETLILWMDQRLRAATLYVGLTLVLTLAAAVAGRAVALLMMRGSTG